MTMLKSNLPQKERYLLPLLLLTLMLAGCPGGSSPTQEQSKEAAQDAGGNTPLGSNSKLVLKGSVGDGPIIQAEVTISDRNGAVIATIYSDDHANYTLDIEAKPVYPLLITVKGGTDIISNRKPDFTLVSFALDPSISTANINPFSTLIAKIAEKLPGGLTVDNIQAATQTVFTQFGFGLDPKLVQDPITTPLNETNAAVVVKASEAFGETLRRVEQALGAQQNIEDVLDAISSDLVDGVMDGRGPAADARIAAATTVVSAQVLTESLSNHLYVDGYDAASRMDVAVNVTQPEANILTGDVVITNAMLTNARRTLVAAMVLASGAELETLRTALDSLTAGVLAKDVETILPEGTSSALDSVIVRLNTATEGEFGSINSHARIEALTIPQSASANGLVVIEAENYATNIKRGDNEWKPTSPAGHSGVGAVEAVPNLGIVNNDNYLTQSPRLDYKVNFVHAGTHYVWIRALAPTSGDNSIHVGLDGTQVATSDRINFRNPASVWAWSNLTMSDQVALVELEKAGTHTINVWMREDGITFDKLLLTTDASYNPGAESGGSEGDSGSGGSGGTTGGGGSTGGGTDDSADGTSTDGTSTDGTSTDGTSTDGTSTDETSTDGGGTAGGGIVSQVGLLRVSPSNPSYFEDISTGKAVYLAGTDNFRALQDWTNAGVGKFDYEGFLDYLQSYGHNFLRMWAWEHFHSNESGYKYDVLPPHVYQRTGPGSATDGKPKFDLTKLDQAYFDRLRQRVIAAGERGVWVSIMLFQGFSLSTTEWGGHPFNKSNNINGVNGDDNGDGDGYETHTLHNSGITAAQERYVKKVIDTVGDLDNVLYEIANESQVERGQVNSYDAQLKWQNHMVDLIHNYEQNTYGRKHPVGMTVLRKGDNAGLFNSHADWISPGGPGTEPAWQSNPPIADGRKVVIADTDHIHPDQSSTGYHRWTWMILTRGHNINAVDGDGEGEDWFKPEDSRWVQDTSLYAARIDLAQAKPSKTLCSTKFCLVNPGKEYLVFQPGSGNFTLQMQAGNYNYEWFDPDTHKVEQSGRIDLDSGTESFNPPFGGHAVLFLQAL
jgi:uncharacterized membrane protein YgcG